MRRFFSNLASHSAYWMGHPASFIIAVLACVVWALSGPLFNYSDTWQLVINTATTVLTFLAVFLIQNSQNRDARAIHLKLDEIIRATDAARNEFIVTEKATEAEVQAREQELHELVSETVDAANEAGARKGADEGR